MGTLDEDAGLVHKTTLDGGGTREKTKEVVAREETTMEGYRE